MNLGLYLESLMISRYRARPPHSTGLCPWSKAGGDWEVPAMVVEGLALIHSWKRGPSHRGWASSAPPVRAEPYQATRSNFWPLTVGSQSRGFWPHQQGALTRLWWQPRGLFISSASLRAWQPQETLQLCPLLAHTYPLRAPSFSTQAILPLWPLGKHRYGPQSLFHHHRAFSHPQPWHPLTPYGNHHDCYPLN